MADRITIIETIYHQQQDEQPTMIEHKFSKELDTQEQLYQRRTKVGEEWQPIDCGWVGAENTGIIILQNEEGDFPKVIPTEEEREEVNKKILEVSYNGSEYSMLVFPQESIRLHPSSPKDLKIRCRSGNARLTIYAIPR